MPADLRSRLRTPSPWLHPKHSAAELTLCPLATNRVALIESHSLKCAAGGVQAPSRASRTRYKTETATASVFLGTRVTLPVHIGQRRKQPRAAVCNTKVTDVVACTPLAAQHPPCGAAPPFTARTQQKDQNRATDCRPAGCLLAFIAAHLGCHGGVTLVPAPQPRHVRRPPRRPPPPQPRTCPPPTSICRASWPHRQQSGPLKPVLGLRQHVGRQLRIPPTRRQRLDGFRAFKAEPHQRRH